MNDEQEKYILENWNKESYPIIGRKLGLKPDTISIFCIKNGLKKRVSNKKPIQKNLITKTYPEVAKEWNEDLNAELGFNLDKVTYGSGKKYWWNCPIGHEPYLATAAHRTVSNSGCPVCARQHKSSFPEQAIYYYIKKIFKNSISSKTFEKLNYLECDIFIPNLNIAIEYDGFRFHENKKEKDEEKNKVFNENGIFLIRVREPKLPKLNTYNAVNIEREDFSNFPSLDKVVRKVFNAILLNFKDRMSNQESKKINEIISEIDTKENRNEILKNLKFKLIKNSVYENYPEILEEWDDDSLDPKTISKHNDIPVKWKCKKCKHKWTAVLKSRTGKMKAGCPNCANNIKFTYEEVKKAFENKGYELISSEYINSKSQLRFKCKKHPEVEEMKVRIGGVLRNAHNCKKCRYEIQSMKNKKYTIKEISKEFQERELKLLSRIYKSVDEKLEFICLKHKEKGIQTTRYINFRHNVDTPCKVCANLNKVKTRKENKDLLEWALRNHCENVIFSKNKRKRYVHFICSKHKEVGEQVVLRDTFMSKGNVCSKCYEDGN